MIDMEHPQTLAHLRIQAAQALLLDALQERPAPSRSTILEALMEVDAAERLMSLGCAPVEEDIEMDEENDDSRLLRLVQPAE
ncbi:hypothetical protein [Teichococcus aestuarii]|uniref:hypothetical protein n=2 Tax=Teichococcus aestuarii TaxID=568898 RepID=UPI0036127911